MPRVCSSLVSVDVAYPRRHREVLVVRAQSARFVFPTGAFGDGFVTVFSELISS